MAPSVESGRPGTEATAAALAPVVIGSGPFRVDLRAGLLRRGHEPIPLRPTPWSVLRSGVERPDQLIAKGELLDAVWGDVAATESVLKQIYSADARVHAGGRRLAAGPAGTARRRAARVRVQPGRGPAGCEGRH